MNLVVGSTATALGMQEALMTEAIDVSQKTAKSFLTPAGSKMYGGLKLLGKGAMFLQAGVSFTSALKEIKSDHSRGEKIWNISKSGADALVSYDTVNWGTPGLVIGIVYFVADQAGAFNWLHDKVFEQK